MPTILTHSFVPIALGRIFTDKKLPLRFWLLAVFCSVLPDADVIGFSFGVRYGDFLGHRGFFHSVFFALILSAAVAILAFHKSPLFSKKWCLIWLFFFCVSASHGVLDTFTDGGLGIALFSPFDTTRYFSPYRPLKVSPIGIGAFLTLWAGEALISEIIWIWTPLIIVLIIAELFRRKKKNSVLGAD